MNRSFDRLFCQRRRRGFGAWTRPRDPNDHSEPDPSMSAVIHEQLNRFRTRIHRSANGKVLGVFAGIAESMGWPCFVTRALGCIALLSIAGTFGVKGFWGTFLACGFFYLLLALLMGQGRRPEETPGNVGLGGYPRASTPYGGGGAPPRPGAVPFRQTAAQGGNPRVDLAEIDRQLEGLNRRIRRMEAIVTDRQYDWEQRLGQ